jgi:chorismate mutase / prephenate dehydratase
VATLRRMGDPASDPFVRRLREQISDNDRTLVERVNKRLQLVAQLKAYKDSRGLDFVDTAREEWMLQDLQRANRGPLSPEGLSALYAEVLALTKREVSRDEA